MFLTGPEANNSLNLKREAVLMKSATRFLDPRSSDEQPNFWWLLQSEPLDLLPSLVTAGFKVG